MDERIIINNFKNLPIFPVAMEKLTAKTDELSNEEKSFLLACAILLIRKYERDRNLTAFAELAYYIILKYSTYFEDYQPLYDLSVNLGLYPISNAIVSNYVINSASIANCLIPSRIKREYTYKNIIETKEQDISRKAILSSDDNELCYIAPTSFGKSSIVIDHIKKHIDSVKSIAIIVPTKSLLMQTYRNIRNASLDIRIIIHDEMYNGQDRFVAVLTQERALRLLDKNPISFDILYIDEAHLLLEKDSRAILLSRLIKLNRYRNADSTTIYLSPLISNKDSLKTISNQTIFEQRIAFNMKEPEFFEYRTDGRALQYNRFINEFYNVGSYSSMYSYIKDNSTSKTFCYLYSPRKIEEFAKELADKLESVDISDELSSVIDSLREYVHDDFLEISLLKKGIIYLHGKLPESIKDYLEYKFSEIPEIRYIIANKVILEGINLPIDSLMILNARNLNGKQLTNLIGRVNRLNHVFSQTTNLERLLPPIHFVNSEKYNSKNGKMENKIKSLRMKFYEDKIENPTLEYFDINSVKSSGDKERAKQTMEYEKSFFSSPIDEVTKLKQRMISLGMTTVYDLKTDLCDIILTRINRIKLKSNLNEMHFLDRLRLIFIDEIYEYIIDDEFSRLVNDQAITYYKMFFQNRKNSLKENISAEIRYYKRRIANGEKYLYIGISYGEESHFDSVLGNGKKVYVDLSKKSDKELANIAIIKQKIEDDFVSYKIQMFVQLMYDYEVLSKEEYYTIVYGTTETKKIFLAKAGLTINIINRLDKDNQLQNISFDKNDNLITNMEFERYKNKADDYYRYELNKYL